MASLTLLVLGAAFSEVQAGQIYRCGLEGKEFSQLPCAKGGARLELESSPTDGRLNQARQVNARAKNLADELSTQRIQREASGRFAKAAGVGEAEGAPAAAFNVKKHSKVKTKSRKAEARLQLKTRFFVAFEPSLPASKIPVQPKVKR